MKEENNFERFNREDPAAGKDEAYKAFTKDKRKRISTSSTEKVEYRRREQGSGDGHSENGGDKRRSYNPNFTSDNRLVGERRPTAERKEFQPRKDSDGRRDYNRDSRESNREVREGGNYADRQYADRGKRRPYEKKEYNNSRGRDYGSSGRGDGAPRRYENQERRPYGSDSRGQRPGGEDNRGYRSYGSENKGYQSRGSENRGYQSQRSENREGYRSQGSDDRGYQPRPSDDRGYQQRDRKPYNQRDEYGSGSQQRGSYGERSKSNYGGAPSERGNYGNRQDGQRPSYQRQNNDRRGPQGPKYGGDNYPTFPAPPIEDKIRLNRYISMSGICSRREADEFIQSGMVTVNDEVITEMGAKVSATDVVKFNGNVLHNEKKVYIVMNKPKGFVTSVEDPHADKTVMDLLKNGCRERVYPVGRLDKSSLGVLLITNDGDLARKLTHPSYEKKKVYQVTLDRPLAKADLDRLVEGIELDDGEIHADAASYVDGKKNEIGIEIHSGRNRIVRRMFEHLGYRVNKLDRVYFAGLTKQRIKRGEWRFLSPREVQALLSGRYE